MVGVIRIEVGIVVVVIESGTAVMGWRILRRGSELMDAIREQVS
jgi:hypothetical protein